MTLRLCCFAVAIAATGLAAQALEPPRFQVATFSAEVTCPLGHPLIAGLRQPAKKIVDPLYANGIVLLGAGKPIVLCTVDWCEIRNKAYERWRKALASAAKTTKDRVLVCCLHQHDAPVADLEAEELLAEVELGGSMLDVEYHEKCVKRTAMALQRCLKKPVPISHIGTGQAKLEKMASNRRVVLGNRVTYARGSASGGNKAFREAPDGLIDPYLKTLSFWNGKEPVVAISAYAIHPMSYYGRGGVSADFVGMARDLRQRENRSVFQIYACGCSGDVTAGKYNDGAPGNRPILARRLYQGMQKAWKSTTRQPLQSVSFRNVKLALDFRKTARLSPASLRKTLKDPKAPKRDRILAAMGMASHQRVASGLPIDFPCIDFGPAQLLLFPAESWVEYQLYAQKQRPSSFVISLGYGECWPGYIPSAQGFKDNFEDIWYWVAPGSDKRMKAAIRELLDEAEP